MGGDLLINSFQLLFKGALFRLQIVKKYEIKIICFIYVSKCYIINVDMTLALGLKLLIRGGW